MANFIHDLRYAIRMMAKRPGFTLIASLTLALGIGANTAIFSAVNAVLLKPLPFPESEQLVDLSETFKPSGWGTVSVPTLEDWKSQNTVFAGISAYLFASFNLEGGDSPQRIPGLSVGANYFDVRGRSWRMAAAGFGYCRSRRRGRLTDRRRIDDPQHTSHSSGRSGT